MEYTRTPDAEDLTASILREGALSAEREATWAEHEALRRRIATANLEGKSTIGIQDNEGNVTPVKVSKYRGDAVADAERLRARANRKQARAEVTDEEVARVKLGFLLNERIPALEREHLSHATKLNEREAALLMAESDPDSPTADERARLTGEVKSHKRAMQELDEMWAVAKADSEALSAQYPDIAEEMEAASTPAAGPSTPEAQAAAAAKIDAERKPVTPEAAAAAMANPDSVKEAPGTDAEPTPEPAPAPAPAPVESGETPAPAPTRTR